MLNIKPKKKKPKTIVVSTRITEQQYYELKARNINTSDLIRQTIELALKQSK